MFLQETDILMKNSYSNFLTMPNFLSHTVHIAKCQVCSFGPGVEVSDPGTE